MKMLPHTGHPEEDAILRLHLSSPEGCRRTQDLFTGIFQDVSVRSIHVLESLQDETPDAADFLLRMYRLSPRELRFRKGCGHKTFHELSARLDLFRHGLRQHLTSLSDVAQASAAPEPE